MPFESDRNVTIFIQGDTSDLKAKLAEVQKLVKSVSNIKVDQNFIPKNVEKQLQELTNRVDKLEKEVDDLNDQLKKGGSGFSAWQAAVVTANQSLQLIGTTSRLARRGVELLTESLDRASEVEGLTQSFNNLQLSVGRFGSDSLPRLRAATKGLISDFDLFQAANNAVILGVDRGEDAFFELANAAVVLGRATGRDAVNAFNDLAFGIGRQSRLILDNLGIVVRAEQAYKDFADAQGRAVASLSDAEQREAFRIEAFRAVREATAQLAAIQETAAISSQRFSATLRNQKDAFAVAISGSSDLQGAFEQLNKSLLSTDIEEVGREVGELATRLLTLAGNIINTVLVSIRDFNTGLTVIEVTIERLLNSQFVSYLSSIATGFSEAASSAAEFAASIPSEVSSSLFNALPQFAQTGITAVKGFFSSAAEEVSGSGGILQEAVTREIEKVAAGVQESIDRSFKIIDTSKILTEEFNNNKLVLNEVKQAYDELIKIQESGVQLNILQAAKLGEVSTALDKYSKELKNSADANKDAGNAADKSSKQLETAIKRITDALDVSSIKIDPSSNPIVQAMLEIEAQSDGTAEATAEANAELREFIRLNATAQNLPAIRTGVGIITSGRAEQSETEQQLNQIIDSTQNFTKVSPSFENALDELEQKYISGAVAQDRYLGQLQGFGQFFAQAKNVENVNLVADALERVNSATKQRSALGAVVDLDIPFLSAGAGALANLDASTGLISDLVDTGLDLAVQAAQGASGQDLRNATAIAIGGIVGGIIGSVIPIIGTALGAAVGTAVAEVFVSKGVFDSTENFVKLFVRDTAGLLGTNLLEDLLEIRGIDINIGDQILEAFFGGDPQDDIRIGVQDFFNDLAGEIEFQGRLFGKGGFFEQSPFFEEGFTPFDITDPNLVLQGQTQTTAIEQRINDLQISDQLLSQFLDLGKAFTFLTDSADAFEGVAGQIGQLLAVELQNPLGLNELQILLQQNEIGLEQFEKALESAFLKGEIGAREFLSTLNSTRDLFQQGIPGVDGIEGVTLAFQNLTDRGALTGLELVDALGDIAAEAETIEGITFDNLDDLLIANGVDASQVEKLFQVLEEKGVTTLEQLKAVTPELAANIGVGLEDLGFEFRDVAAATEEFGIKIDESLLKLQELEEQVAKDYILNVQVTVDSTELDNFVSQNDVLTGNNLESPSSNE